MMKRTIKSTVNRHGAACSPAAPSGSAFFSPYPLTKSSVRTYDWSAQKTLGARDENERLHN